MAPLFQLKTDLKLTNIIFYKVKVVSGTILHNENLLNNYINFSANPGYLYIMFWVNLIPVQIFFLHKINQLKKCLLYVSHLDFSSILFSTNQCGCSWSDCSLCSLAWKISYVCFVQVLFTKISFVCFGPIKFQVCFFFVFRFFIYLLILFFWQILLCMFSANQISV
jgi:hypothetical protein